ncbi:MAG: RsbRD N-terminal domain-containing protein [Thermodesulfobacteriota bacterium]
MGLTSLLENKKAVILDRWFNLVLETYPPDTTQFLCRQKDSFANPVGGNIREGLSAALTEFIASFSSTSSGRLDTEGLKTGLDRVIRIRAVQNFTPSQAVGFVRDLKAVIKEVLGREAETAGGAGEWAALEEAMDELLFLAFDLYSACREQLHEIRIKDEQRRMHLLLKRAKMISDDPEPEKDRAGRDRGGL